MILTDMTAKRVGYLFCMILLVVCCAARCETPPPNSATPPVQTTSPTQPISPTQAASLESKDTDDETAPGDQTSIDDIKKKYWSMEKKTKVQVVQERVHPSSGRLEIAADVGSLIGDPFLSTHTVGGSIGFHFNEVYSLHLMGWGALVTGSSAFTTLETQAGVGPNVNAPSYALALEGRANIIYGKTSFLDSKIIYLDSYLAIGAGEIKTLSGSDLLLQAGIGEQLRISDNFSIFIDYRAIWYRDVLLATIQTANNAVGQNLGTRSNFSSLITVGASFYLSTI